VLTLEKVYFEGQVKVDYFVSGGTCLDGVSDSQILMENTQEL
jgi:hypothetical protein